MANKKKSDKKPSETTEDPRTQDTTVTNLAGDWTGNEDDWDDSSPTVVMKPEEQKKMKKDKAPE